MSDLRGTRRAASWGWAAVLLAMCGTATAQTPAAAKAASTAKTSARPVLPESVGFSTERLERLHALMQAAADEKQVAGAVTILARHGRIVDYRAYGVRDLASGAPMTKDTIFRAFSMTKPVTAVAMMLLYEQGKWLPSDPIAKYVPEFAKLKVFKSVDAAGQMVVEEPAHAPTMQELMSHTAGFVYGFFGTGPVDEAYKAANVMQSASLHEMIDKLARIPLAYQPGSKWVYSVSMDVEGYIVERLSGKTLPEFMEQSIFGPLGMRDTAFYVPAEKRGRFATLYRADEKGELATEPPDRTLRGDYSAVPTMPSGGGGLVTTAEDYFRFAQMLGNGGELDGVRVLSPASVRLMSSNHLLPHLLTGEFRIGQQVMRPGLGYGYNCAVVYDPPLANLPEGRGTFFWDGAAGTWFWVDPTDDVVFVGMIQRLGGPGMPSLQYLSRAVVYQALLDPRK
jgi:CubicO group peptidase (beta-lactamase class C family)